MKKFLIIFILFYTFVDVNAQLFPTLGGQRAGISTAQFLKIGVGARASALGDAFVAIANDVSALYWNPAGLVQFKNDEIIFSHNNWVVDINHDFLGGVYHFGGNHALFAPFGTGEFFSFSDIAIALTYSQKMTDKFSFGVTVRYIEETLDKLKMRGVMLDLGTYYWTGLGSTRFAVTVSNFGAELAPDGNVVLVGNKSSE
jgi:long-subunit fatty acid transport protein